MRTVTLLALGLALVVRVCAAEPDFSSDAFEQYRKTLTFKLTPGLFTVVGNDAPQSAASIAANAVNDGTIFVLRFGSVDNPRVIKYEYQDGHPIDGVKAIDVLFAKALDWKDIATAHNVTDLTKSLGNYNGHEYYFRITGDDAYDGIYLDLASKVPSFSLPEIKQMHAIFGFLVFLDTYQGGSHVLESYLQQSRQETDALFK
jgi:hypothetical protein